MAETLLSFVNGYGQVSYSDLRNFVSSSSLSEFTRQAPHPFLVGKDLYEGELKSKVGGTLASTSTMKFSAAGLRKRQNLDDYDEELHAATTLDVIQNPDLDKARDKISRSIYMLRQKNNLGDTAEGAISIGRNGMNDIVIQDKVVSGKHSQFIIRNGMYFIEDKNSTNGTKVDSIAVPPGTLTQLHLNSNISLGRLIFVFTPPLLVYRAMRKDILGY